MPTTPYCPLLFLWQQKSVFIGSLSEPIDVSTGASTLMLGLDKPIRYITQDMQTSMECRSLLIPAGSSVVVDTQGAFFFNCTLDPMGTDFFSLSKLMTKKMGTTYYQLQDEQDHIRSLLSICSPPLSANKVQSTLNHFLQLGLRSIDKNEGNLINDQRIERVIDQIKNSIGENTSLTELANLVNLSPAYLSELFKSCTGLPVRRYRLWHRLYSTVENTGLGKNLTEAAMDCGFNDSSHFIRTFRSMLGMTPTSIFTQATPLQFLTPTPIDSHILKQDPREEFVT